KPRRFPLDRGFLRTAHGAFRNLPVVRACARHGVLPPNRGKATIFCVTEMPSNAVAVLLRSGRDQPSFRSGGHPAVKPTAPLSRHYPHNARDSGSSLGAAPWSKFA